MCFSCVADDPIGLKLTVYSEDKGRYIAGLRPKPEHQDSAGQLRLTRASFVN